MLQEFPLRCGFNNRCVCFIDFSETHNNRQKQNLDLNFTSDRLIQNGKIDS